MSKYSYNFRAAWCDLYRWSMQHGLEYCRICGDWLDLTFDHIIPRVVGGSNTRDNVTILCAGCNNDKGMSYYHDLKPLSEEDPAGWKNVVLEDVQLGDFTLAGNVIEIGMWVASHRYYFIGENPPFPNRRGVRSIDTKLATVPVFTADIKELINA